MRRIIIPVLVVAGLAIGGCSQVRDLVDDAASAALRTAASEALKQAADKQGQPLAADPVCSGSVKTGEQTVNISCSAKTQAGLPVTGSAVVKNLGDSKNCTATLTVRIGSEAPVTQDFPGCNK